MRTDVIDMQGVTTEYIGAMCAEYRTRHLKMTQMEVAQKCHVSRELVSKFERGSISNSLVFLFFIKNGIFNWVPYDRWCGWLGYMPPNDTVSD